MRKLEKILRSGKKYFENWEKYCENNKENFLYKNKIFTNLNWIYNCSKIKIFNFWGSFNFRLIKYVILNYTIMYKIN